MTPLYSNADFQAAGSQDRLPLQCLNCSQTFFMTKKRVQDASNPNRRGSDRGVGNNGCFCSRACVDAHKGTPILVSCLQCSKSFKKLASEIKSSPNHFCCKSHAAKYNNAHKTKGTRVSKLEVWLQSQLPVLYPGMKFDFNQTDAIDAELDIYIPSLRLAFELNGIFHYEPIFGEEQLARTQGNDARKFQACLEHGIELCLIDVSTFTYYKARGATRFLEIIQEVIDLRSQVACG